MSNSATNIIVIKFIGIKTLKEDKKVLYPNNSTIPKIIFFIIIKSFFNIYITYVIYMKVFFYNSLRFCNAISNVKLSKYSISVPIGTPCAI